MPDDEEPRLRPPRRAEGSSRRREGGKPSGPARRSAGGGRRDDGRSGSGGSRGSRGQGSRGRGGDPDRREGGATPRGTRGFGPYGAPDEESGRRPRKPARSDGRRAPRRDDTRDDERPTRRPALRTVGERPARSGPKRTRDRAPSSVPRRRRRSGPADVEVEIRRLAGRNGDRFLRLLMEAADAFAHDREREALRILRPVREPLADAPSVRELVGLCQYRLGNYAAAAKELEAYAELSGAVDQNPVLMDCYRAQRRWRKVGDKWDELREVSPSAAAVAEGRIVYAGALADQGRLDQALATLRARGDNVRNPKEHHLRLWYALADLEERAGNHAAARELFDRVRRADPGYADVAERRAALG